MKKIFQYTLAAFLLSAGTACTKNLDIDPTASIDEQNALSTSSGVQTALNGAYANLGSGTFFGGEAFVMSDLLGDAGELGWKGTFAGLTQIFNKDIPKNNGFITDTWLQGYRVIN